MGKRNGQEYLIMYLFIILGGIFISLICKGFLPEEFQGLAMLGFTLIWAIWVSLKAEKSGALRRQEGKDEQR